MAARNSTLSTGVERCQYGTAKTISPWKYGFQLRLLVEGAGFQTCGDFDDPGLHEMKGLTIDGPGDDLQLGKMLFYDGYNLGA